MNQSTVQKWEDRFDALFPDVKGWVVTSSQTGEQVTWDKPIKDFISSLLASQRKEDMEETLKVIEGMKLLDADGELARGYNAALSDLTAKLQERTEDR